MKTQTKALSEILTDHAEIIAPWAAEVVINDDNLTYLITNSQTREALWVDPMIDDWEILIEKSRALKDYRFVAVIDTHTHADHISCAGKLADALQAPLIMHQHAPTKLVSLRVSRDTLLPTAAGPLTLLVTPGHTWDGITPIWGPFIFGGDTILYGDTGRDDLPTGNPEEHFDSLTKIKAHAKPTDLFLPGHDNKGGRASSWATQMQVNASLTQGREQFVAEAGAFTAPAPKLLKESLFANFK